jgi:hypothetical protein
MHSTKHSVPTSKDPAFDREAHQKKVKEWFMNPSKFSHEIEPAQRKYSGQCLHPTSACFIKKECDKLLAEGKSITNSVPHLESNVATLRHITDDDFVDTFMDEQVLILKITFLMILVKQFWPIFLV